MQLEESRQDLIGIRQMIEEIHPLFTINVIEAMEKAIDDSGKKLRILGGYAAGTSKDYQDEQFLMKGMDFSYLGSPQGKINWDHNSRMIIGRPLQVGMVEKGLYVKGVLSRKEDYPHATHPDVISAMDQAEWAWDHALRHQSDPNTVVPLAWSVEGKKMNKGGMIVKSVVTDVALTDKAVNPTDCTVRALAKSMRDMVKQEISENVSLQSGLTIEEISHAIKNISDHEGMFNFFKSIGLSVDHTNNLYHTIRSL